MENKLYIKTHPSVEEKILSFPEDIQPKIRTIRNLIISTAENLEEVMEMEETLKWGEPSYITKKGSTIRISWSEKKPEQYGLYFTCTSSLVDTFKVIYADLLLMKKAEPSCFTRMIEFRKKSWAIASLWPLSITRLSISAYSVDNLEPRFTTRTSCLFYSQYTQ